MKRVVSKKPKAVKTNKSKSASKPKSLFLRLVPHVLVVLFFGIIASAIYSNHRSLLQVLRTKRNQVIAKVSPLEERKTENDRIFELLSRHDNKVVGFDVSEYQRHIYWSKIDKIQNDFSLGFVFIRATAGSRKKDRFFKANWQQSKTHYFIRGAYHYYRPNENSIAQAENFIATVDLQKGDLPPVLDIEKLPKNQSIANLKVGLRRWLTHVEAHYKVKPIIYSGERYYTDFLKKEFNEYPFWIANYNPGVATIKPKWQFWQFTEKAQIPGIKGMVDVNVFNGTEEELKAITLK